MISLICFARMDFSEQFHIEGELLSYEIQLEAHFEQNISATVLYVYR